MGDFKPPLIFPHTSSKDKFKSIRLNCILTCFNMQNLTVENMETGLEMARTFFFTLYTWRKSMKKGRHVIKR